MRHQFYFFHKRTCKIWKERNGVKNTKILVKQFLIYKVLFNCCAENGVEISYLAKERMGFEPTVHFKTYIRLAI